MGIDAGGKPCGTDRIQEQQLETGSPALYHSHPFGFQNYWCCLLCLLQLFLLSTSGYFLQEWFHPCSNSLQSFLLTQWTMFSRKLLRFHLPAHGSVAVLSKFEALKQVPVDWTCINNIGHRALSWQIGIEIWYHLHLRPCITAVKSNPVPPAHNLLLWSLGYFVFLQPAWLLAVCFQEKKRIIFSIFEPDL